jgi:hypothetical protein
MITGVRSAILCNEVLQNADGTVDYLGLQGAALVLDSNPNILNIWLSLHLELDRKPATGRVRVTTDDFDLTVPFHLAAGWALSAVAFPMNIPVRSEGPLTVSVSEDRLDRKPYRFKWSLGFETGAKILEPQTWDRYVEVSRQSSEILLQRLAPIAKPSN